MNPCFFASANGQRLFGLFNEPYTGPLGGSFTGTFSGLAPAGSRPGVILCYPVAQEYMRCHWAFRKLTTLLTQAGFAVFRFDYAGTGDSSGEFADMDCSQWKADLRAAITEFKAVSGVKKVSLIGLRLGAALAVEVAAEIKAEMKVESPNSVIQDVILWDPVVTGQNYLDELGRIHEESLKVARSAPAPTVAGESYGYVFGKRLLEELRELNLSSTLENLAGTTSKVHLIHSEGLPVYQTIAARLPLSKSAYHIPDDGVWDVLDKATGALLPNRILQAVVSLLNGQVPAASAVGVSGTAMGVSS